MVHFWHLDLTVCSQNCTVACTHNEVNFYVIGFMCRSVAVASRLAYDILSGLSYMNSLGLVHRNLSPSSVLFDHQVFHTLHFCRYCMLVIVN